MLAMLNSITKQMHSKMSPNAHSDKQEKENVIFAFISFAFHLTPFYSKGEVSVLST